MSILQQIIPAHQDVVRDCLGKKETMRQQHGFQIERSGNSGKG
jgi:hypothetical protein